MIAPALDPRIARTPVVGLGPLLCDLRRLMLAGLRQAAQRRAAAFVADFGAAESSLATGLVRLASETHAHRHHLPGEVLRPPGEPMATLRIVTSGALQLIGAGGEPLAEVGVGGVVGGTLLVEGVPSRLGLRARSGAGVLTIPPARLRALAGRSLGLRQAVHAEVQQASAEALLGDHPALSALDAEVRRQAAARFVRVDVPVGLPAPCAALRGLSVVVEGRGALDGRSVRPGAVVETLEVPIVRALEPLVTLTLAPEALATAVALYGEVYAA
ncbi:MAG: hypothetical protein H6704_23770 [Myxococcales bacterium]|nr:hypothetical protein [Myxococcales bacterium]